MSTEVLCCVASLSNSQLWSLCLQKHLAGALTDFENSYRAILFVYNDIYIYWKIYIYIYCIWLILIKMCRFLENFEELGIFRSKGERENTSNKQNFE